MNILGAFRTTARVVFILLYREWRLLGFVSKYIFSHYQFSQLSLCRKRGRWPASRNPVFIRRNMQSERHLLSQVARRRFAAFEFHSGRADWFSDPQGRSKIVNELRLIIMKQGMPSGAQTPDGIIFVPFRTIKLPALPVYSVNLQIQVASRNLRPYIRVWFTSRTLHRTGGYNDKR